MSLEEKDLVKGRIYRVSGQNFVVAVWTGEVFRGPKVQDKKLVFAEEQPYWAGLPFGTCTPYEELSNLELHPPLDGRNLLFTLQILNNYVWEHK